jgi:hypothetical protein
VKSNQGQSQKSVMPLVVVLLVLAFPFSSVFAHPITRQEAELVAKNFSVLDNSKLVQRGLKKTGYTVIQVAPLYWQNEEIGYRIDLNPAGFMLVSGITELSPVKLVSYDGSFDAVQEHALIRNILKNMFQAKQALGYGTISVLAPLMVSPTTESNLHLNQEATPRESLWNDLLLPSKRSVSSAVAEPPAEPLLKSRWSQDDPLNRLMPVIQGKRAPAGCSAISQAQLMYYWRFPLQGRGQHTYQWNSQSISADFGHAYQWDKMLDRYESGLNYSVEQVEAVSRLTADVATSLETEYSANESLAVPNLNNSLSVFFRYSSDIAHLDGANKSTGEMFEIIRSQIDRKWPVLLAVFSDNLAHSVVVDGYRTDMGNMVHINSGWGGFYDAYYALDHLYNLSNCSEYIEYNIRPDEEVYADDLPAPSGINGRALSGSEIQLSWNPGNFPPSLQIRLQRLEVDGGIWTTLALLPATSTSYLDQGLHDRACYRYRIQVTDHVRGSWFTETANIRTLNPDYFPAVISLDRQEGVQGAPVGITGRNLDGVSKITLDSLPVTFRVNSSERIEFQVPTGVSEGNAELKVMTHYENDYPVYSGGFRVVSSLRPDDELFVPAVVSTPGLNGARFTTELTLTNKGLQAASLILSYRDSTGNGSGQTQLEVPAGQQIILADAIQALKNSGIPLDDSRPCVGTLRIQISGLLNPADLRALARTTTLTSKGKAGLAYPAIFKSQALTQPIFLNGLRQNGRDRSNVALQNPGSQSVSLRLTVFSANPSEMPVVLPTQILEPAEFRQFSGILQTAGFAEGYVKVEREGDAGLFYAYAVVNDQGSSDGSFIPPQLQGALSQSKKWTLPVIVESAQFRTELTLANLGNQDRQIRLTFVADSITAPEHTVSGICQLKPGEQKIIPEAVQWLREQSGTSGMPAGPTYAGAFFAEELQGTSGDFFLGARTASINESGRFGLFYTSTPQQDSAPVKTWICGLQQNAENRSNLALVNVGDKDDQEINLMIQVREGSGQSAWAFIKTVKAKEWIQLNSLLSEVRFNNAYLQIERISGSNSFLSYAVINDGGLPGQRTGDGSFIPALP